MLVTFGPTLPPPPASLCSRTKVQG